MQMLVSSIYTGGAIWHPKCGPGPIAENGGLTPANNLDSQSSVPHTGMNGHSPDKDRDYDRASNSGASEAQVRNTIICY